MQHFIYPKNQYMKPGTTGSFVVDYEPENEEFLVKTRTVTGWVVNRLSAERAAMLAGFLLSKHPAIVKGDAMAFSLATRACDAIHEPDFTVITPTNGLRATTGEPPLDGDGDDQDVKVPDSDPEDLGRLHPDQERRLTALREANDIFAGRLTHDRLFEWVGWVLNGGTPAN